MVYALLLVIAEPPLNPSDLLRTGTAAEHLSLFDSIIHLAQDRTQVSAFNLASEALNNAFFLNGLVRSIS